MEKGLNINAPKEVAEYRVNNLLEILEAKRSGRELSVDESYKNRANADLANMMSELEDKTKNVDSIQKQM